MAVNYLHNEEMEYDGKFGHILGRIEHVFLMSRINVFY